MIDRAEVFVDTNVLIYARDAREASKREQARAWLSVLAERECMRLNLQVVNELTRWLLANERTRSLAAIREEVETLHYWGNRAVDLEEVELAWAIRSEYGFQWFDTLLIAAADRLGCRYFLTEDLTDGVRCGPVTIVNPFRTLPSTLLNH